MNDEVPTNLTVVACCATCVWFRGWLDNAWCERYQLRILPQTKCDNYERKTGTPLWIIAESIDRDEL